MKKKLAGVIIVGVIMNVLVGCSSTEDIQEAVISEEPREVKLNEAEKEEEQTTAEDDGKIIESSYSTSEKYTVGDTVGMTSYSGKSFGATIDVTLTDWGTVYENFVGVLTYIHYEIQNTGSREITVGNGIFNVYADNYSVEQYASMDDVVYSAEISGGRQVSGTIYVKLDPNTVTSIEVECGDFVWVIKGPTAVVDDSAIPADIRRDTEAIAYGAVAGEYSGIGLCAIMNMYSSIEDEYIGNIEIQGKGELTGQLVEISTNVYQVITTDGSVVLLGIYTDNENPNFDLYIDGQHIDSFVMTSPFIS